VLWRVEEWKGESAERGEGKRRGGREKADEELFAWADACCGKLGEGKEEGEGARVKVYLTEDEWKELVGGWEEAQ